MKNSIIPQFKNIIDEALNEKLNIKGELYRSVIDAMNYSVSIGGKRIRPCLVLEFARVCGGNLDAALNMACALEMVHTYSLIHDDLPCMDNDDMRRGMPSCHKKFGEDIALLAGDGLLTLAFYTASSCTNTDPVNVNKCINVLSQCSGVDGMVGGQVIDLESEEKKIPLDTLVALCEKKTSCLLQAACMLGCIVSGADESLVSAAKSYGKNLGLAFQIIDDILDVTGDEKTLGKPIGSDNENNKSTFVTLLGLEESKLQAKKYTENAIDALAVFGNKAEQLKILADDLCGREF